MTQTAVDGAMDLLACDHLARAEPVDPGRVLQRYAHVVKRFTHDQVMARLDDPGRYLYSASGRYSTRTHKPLSDSWSGAARSG